MVAAPATELNRGGRSSRTRSARALLVVIFFLLRIPDAFVYYVSVYYGSTPNPKMQIVILITALWTTIFLIAMWIHKRWARYLLILFVVGMAVVDGTVLGLAFVYQTGFVPVPTAAFTMQLLFYAVAATIVIRSRLVRRFCDRS
jgi:hypothetical protein